MQQVAPATRSSPVRRPLAWLAVAAAAGTVLGAQLPYGPLLPVACGAALLCAGLAMWLGRGAWPALLACCLALGACWASLRADVPPLPTDGPMKISGRVAQAPRVRDGAMTLYVEHVTAAWDSAQMPLPGKLWLRYHPDTLPGKLPQAGQLVTVDARVTAPDGVRNPGGFDFRAYLQRQGAYLAAYAYQGLRVTGAPGGGLWTWAQRSRQALGQRLDQWYGSNAPIVRGMLLGDKQDLEDADQQAFRRSGISHLLAVSGLHVGFIALPLLFLARKLSLWAWQRTLAVAIVLFAYCLLVGAPAGTLRACAMMLVLQGASVAGREYDPLSALGAVCLAGLIVQPASLADAGFTLSFGAVLGMVLLGNPLRKVFHFRCKWLGSTLATSLSAQLGVLPLCALYFGEVSLLGLVTNLPAVPLSGVVVLSGFAGMALDWLWPPLAFPFVWVAARAMDGILLISRAVAAVPFATLRVACPPWYVIAGFLAAMGLASPFVRLGRWRRLAAVCAALALPLGLSYALTWHGARYTQLDVGQGDAAVLQTEGRVLVIDTGSQGTSGLLDYLRHEGLSIDTLYISHPHEDHAGALVDVLAAGIPVGRILLSDDLDEARMDAPAREALLTAQQRGIPIGGLHAGERESWGTGSAVEVLGPRPRSAAQDVNDRSLVLRFTVAGVRILTTGDVTQRAEPLAQVDCDVLKVAHHGSGAATGTDFLRAAGPRLALIGVGRRNLYGHPTPETLSRLFQAGARVLRTDQGGALLLTLADGQVRAQTFLSAEGVQ